MSFFTNGAQIEIDANSSLQVLSNGIFALSAKKSQEESQYILCSYSPQHLELIENIITGNSAIVKNIELQGGKLYFNISLEGTESSEGDETITELSNEAENPKIFINYLGILNPISSNETPNDTTNIIILDTTKQKHINHITDDSSNAQVGDYIVMTTTTEG